MTLLNVSGVDTYYGNIQALKKMDLHVEKGEIVTILGANGAGKTTTMKTIPGLLKPKVGKVTFHGQNITGMRHDQLLRQGIVLVPGGRAIITGMTVLEHVVMGAYHRIETGI